MSCCRSIQSQVDQVEKAKALLSNGLNTRSKARAVWQSLDTLRTVLGTYKVNPTLTSTFRQEIEPGLASVWSKRDLEQYSQRVNSFSDRLLSALSRWRGRYCRAAAAT
jgi:hypothetical protein